MIQGPDGRRVAAVETISENRRLRPLPCGADGEAEFQERTLALSALVSGLPEDLRTAAEALMEGASFTQVAEDAGMSETTLRKRLRRVFSAAGFSKNFAEYPAD
jgi:DNA-directed RNA polymerase specialized sigma24 family protein